MYGSDMLNLVFFCFWGISFIKTKEYIACLL